jgi:putative ABC transport system substrate-binding protein
VNRIRRRLTVAALAALGSGWSVGAWAQERSARIGVLAPRRNSIYLPAVLKRLGELGYVEHRNLVVDFRSADGVADRFAPLARDLIRAKSDLVIAIGPEQAPRALLETKADVPVVILAVEYDPVKAGFVESLRRPGGNLTGMVLLQPELAGKRIQILRELVPKAKRVLVLADRFSTEQLDSVRQAGAILGVEIVSETFGAPPYDLDSAFAKGLAAGSEAVAALASPVMFDQRARIVELALKHRLPSVAANIRYAEAGFLVSYGVNTDIAFVRAGDIIARILKGARAGEIPIEQPTHFEFAINRRTAKALGIAIPPTLMVRADKVIE